VNTRGRALRILNARAFSFCVFLDYDMPQVSRRPHLSPSGSLFKLTAAGALGYLIGTFPTADIAAKYAGRNSRANVVDLRASGTGNPGALNAAKVLGLRWGGAVLAGDVLKGAAASLLGRRLAGDNGAYAAGATAVIGHCAPVWTGFRGGKGLATSAGTSLVCFPAYMPFDLGLGGATLVLSGGRAGTASYLASGVFVAAALFWWRAKKGNLWGPRASAGLPLYAIASSAIIAYRFLTAAPTVTKGLDDAEFQAGLVVEESAVAS